ncbi:MAG: hypothetical protein NT118_11985, partial [Lentisphaerae bacterium]|nr:hypothetical protein [Lentisphaerota bacterium]
MKNIIQIITAVVIISGMTGCATPYMTDRSRDAADIFTIRMGFGAGVKTHVGPVQVGLLFNLDCLGLRGGEMVWAEKVVNTGADFDYILGGVSEFDTRCLYPDSMAWKRDKCYRLSYVLLGIPVNTPVLCRLPNRYSPGYFTDIEVVGGLWTTLRFGFNPGELFDFILGWTTVDIYGDDIGIVQED